jgi:thiamine-monophosphate kinase
MLLKDLGEDSLIKRLERKFNVPNRRIIKAIGDDTAVTAAAPGECLLTTTDNLVEGVHFSLDYTPAYQLGRKTLNVSLSDIAAMGGMPLFFLITTALPADTTVEFLDEFYDGVKSAADEFSVALIGGNTSASNLGIITGSTVLGETSPDKVITRSGAKAGDTIYVTGSVGLAALGLKTLLAAHGPKGAASGPLRDAVQRHLDPSPRVKAGRLLAEGKLASSMIDLSDGLVKDLERLARESRVGARIESSLVPITDALKKDPDELELALTGGEDYELLFTSGPEKKGAVASVGEKLELPITAVGEIVPGEKGVTVLDASGKPLKLAERGFEHFRGLGT